MNYSAVPERVWARLEMTEDGCWLWPGATTGHPTHKYGVVWLEGKLETVHRGIYRRVVREVTDDEHVHHRCGSTLCANPLHLEALPIREHIGKWHRIKTHCPSGHAYDEANTRLRPDGARACRACARETMRRKRALARAS